MTSKAMKSSPLRKQLNASSMIYTTIWRLFGGKHPVTCSLKKGMLIPNSSSYPPSLIDDEIKNCLFSMNSLKSPSPDELLLNLECHLEMQTDHHPEFLLQFPL